MMNDYLLDTLSDMFGREGYKTFPVDIVKEENSYLVYAEMPGVKKEDISLSFEDGILKIEAKKPQEQKKYIIHERSFMKMKREITFGDIHEESLEAKLTDGILTVCIHLEPKKAVRTIEIQ